jgi:hypothetical protein
MWATRTHRRQSTSSFNPCLTAYAQERENVAPSTVEDARTSVEAEGCRACGRRCRGASEQSATTHRLDARLRSVNQTTAIFSLEDFLEADATSGRSMAVLEFERTAGDNQGRRLGARTHLSLLHHYAMGYSTYWSILLLVAALVLGVVSYISLCYSDARESPRDS